MSFDQLLLAGEFQTREFKTSFETDRLLESDLEQAAINKLLSILWNWARNVPWSHAKYVGCSVVHYLVMHENEQPLVSKYRLALPVEDEISVELKRARWQNKKEVKEKNVF